MADISKITLPSGNTYDIKDEVARSMISGGVSFNFCSNAANTPAGVTWKKDSQTITGTLSPESASAGQFYLVPASDAENFDVYAEYVSVGEVGSKRWEKIGDTKAKITTTSATVAKLKTAGSRTNGSAATFAQGTDSFTANIPTTPAEIDTSKFSGGQYTQGTDVFTASVANETLTLGFSQGEDSFTPAALTAGFYTAGSKGSAAAFTQGNDSFTANVPTTVTLPTFEDETVIKSITA